MEIEELENKIKELSKELNKLKENRNKRWRANKDEFYYRINGYQALDVLQETNVIFDKYQYEMGNYFKTEEQAKEYLKKIKIYMQLKDLALRLNNGEKIDWNNEDQIKYFIYYKYNDNEIYQDVWRTIQELGQIYCLNETFLNIAKNEIGEDNLKLLFKEE